jgi:hypothetical protein
MRVYGPYTRKDGRKHVVLWNGETTQTVSYPRYIMEAHLGRKLEEWETVDHINRDFTDDRIENLRLVGRSQHSKDDATYAKLIKNECVWCGTKLLRRPSKMREAAKRAQAGPFCSKKCIGEYGRMVQNSMLRLPIQDSPQSEYYQKEK